MSSDEEGQKERLKNAAKALLAAVEEIDDGGDSIVARCTPLVKLFNASRQSEFLFEDLTLKKQETLLLDVFRASNKGFMKRFFPALHGIVEAIVGEEAYVPESAFENDGGDEADKQGSDDENNEAIECLAFLKCAAMCTEAALEGKVSQQQVEGAPVQISSQVGDVATQLHDILLSLHDCGEEGLAARNAVLSLCESWWLQNAVNRDSLIAQVLPLIVLQASDPTEFQKSQIKKLVSFQDAFQVIDFLNPSSDSLRSLLLKVASNPLCLKLPEGRRFLASLFRDPDLVPDLHQAFRAQIPHATKTILQAYGEIYYKAWCAAEDSSETETQEVIEHQVLQDLMHSAIHVASPAMAKSILITLGPLHSDKKTKRVADLLNRLYGPILWRSLSAASPGVRKNAVAILEQVFPLHDPNLNQMKAAMEKCATALKNALQDVDVNVRIAASDATANICTLFWEALPSSDIRMLLNHIVLEHASDAVSAAVRAQALATTTALLDIQQSHAVLRPLLPSLGNLMHDKSEKVRLAAVKLLLRIKSTPGIHFYHVVPVDHICARFSEEEKAHRNPKNPVNKELTALMLSSYFPQGGNVSAGDQIQRTLTFLMSNPEAAASFYANLAEFLEVESVAKFIVMLLACLKSAVQTDQSQQAANCEASKKRRRGGTNKAAASTEEQTMSASNTKLMVALAETICTLWESIQEPLTLPVNEPSRKLLCARLGEANLANFLAHFEQKAFENQSTSSDEKEVREDSFRVCHALLRCASLIPKDTIEGVSSFVADSLKTIAHDGSIQSINVTPHLALLARWGMIDDIASALASSLESAFDDEMGLTLLSPLGSSTVGRKTRRSTSKGKGKQSKGKFKLPDFSPKFACDLIDDILRGTSSSCILLRKSLFASTSACDSIGGTLQKAMIFAERLLYNQTTLGPSSDELEVDLVLGCSEAYGRFVLHRAQTEDKDKVMKEVRFILDWTTEHVLPVVLKVPATGSDLQDLDISRISNVSDSLMLHSCSGLMSPPKQRINVGASSSRLSSAASKSGNLRFSCQSMADLVARVLMQFSCLFLSEFVLIGGAFPAELESHVSRWCAIFDPRDNADERAMSIRFQLLPSFMRLGVQLCKCEANFALLKELIVKCDQGSVEGSEGLLQTAAKSLLPSGFGRDTPLMGDLLDSMLVAFGEIARSSETLEAFETADSANKIWSSLSIGAVVDIIARNQKACKILAEKVLFKLKSHHGDVDNEVVFYAKCLSFLLSVMKSRTFVEKIRDEINVESLPKDDIRSMMESLVATSA